MMPPLLTLKDVSLTFGNQSLLNQVDLTVSASDRICLVGRNGSGKSTLGKLLSGQLTPSQGSVQVDGSPLPTRGLRPVQWLPQSPELAVNPRWRVGKILAEAWTPPDTLMAAFGIEDEWLKRFPSALSGGELQEASSSTREIQVATFSAAELKEAGY